MRPRDCRIKPPVCSVLAANETPARRTPSMIDRNSCVTGKWSVSTRSLVINNQRARRSGRLCRALQAAACEVCTISNST